MRRMLCTLVSGALRCGAGHSRKTRLPRCAPERASVRCGTRSTGASGGLRFPQAKVKDSRQRAKVRRQKRRKGPEKRLDGYSVHCAFEKQLPVVDGSVTVKERGLDSLFNGRRHPSTDTCFVLFTFAFC